MTTRGEPARATALTRTTGRPPVRAAAILAALLIVAAAVAVATRVATAPPEPATRASAENGLVAFGREGDIVTVDPETGAEQVLVGGSDEDGAPVFSWNGDRLAFTRTIGGDSALFAVATAGGDPVPLTSEPLDVVGPSWSYDDSALAFTNGDLVIAAADGSGAEALVLQVRAQKAHWRPPDGAQLQFSSGSDNVSLYLVGRDGSGLVPIALPDGTVVKDPVVGWTPDGTRLVTTRSEVALDGGRRSRLHVLTVGADGVVLVDATDGPALVDGPHVSGISPDGTHVVVPGAETLGGDGWRPAIVALDGSTEPVAFGPTFVGEDFGIAWSPDGASVVVRDGSAEVTWILVPGSDRAQRASWHAPNDDVLAWQRVVP